MATNPIDNKIYTYDDYLKFPEDTVAEIIYGRISAVLPAPSRIHQTIVSRLMISIGRYIVYILSDNGYEMPNIYTFNDKIKVNIYDNLEIDFTTFNLV
jgi:hypothetical protein